jgi:outer membrane protein assembly factor BamB
MTNPRPQQISQVGVTLSAGVVGRFAKAGVSPMRTHVLSAMLVFSSVATSLSADWPQWRGLHRDGVVSDFKAPATWPKELTKKWAVTVGDGAASPAVVGDRIYVFAREENGEGIRCLEAATGKEIWHETYSAEPSTDPGRFFGPRSSPAVAEGKIVTLGARGLLSCFDAATGKKLWSKDDFRSWPRFYVASSPLIVDGLCIAQLGGDQGAVVAYDLSTGTEKWKVADLPTAYASPVLMSVAGTKLVVAQVSDGIVAINVADGKKVWEKFTEGGGSRYKATTPIVSGDTLIYFDAAAYAVKLEKEGDKIVDKQLWKHQENRVEFNTPVLHNGLLIGLTGPSGSGAHQFFCVDIESNKATWTSAAPRIAAAGPPGAPQADEKGGKGGFGFKGGSGGKGGFGKGGGGGIRADAGYGSVVDAGSAIFSLTPNGELMVFQLSGKELKQVASYKVGSVGTYAYPIVLGNRIYVKDADAVTMWAIE